VTLEATAVVYPAFGYFRVAGLTSRATVCCAAKWAVLADRGGFHSYRNLNAEYYFCALVAKSTQ
jgi:hypothetical protein